MHEFNELTQKLVKGGQFFRPLREEDIQIGVTPKEEVYREDKVVLYRFTPKVEPSLNIPILIVYALVNRPYIVDLQEGRSLVANLLNLGMDVYLIDWGYPSRGDRFPENFATITTT
jgi:polyhydroxyalkanoate synthase